jgi:hypothetical protein
LDHALDHEWAGYRECHVGGDFLLIYRLDQKTKTQMIVFTRSGTHAELFTRSRQPLWPRNAHRRWRVGEGADRSPAQRRATIAVRCSSVVLACHDRDLIGLPGVRRLKLRDGRLEYRA